MFLGSDTDVSKPLRINEVFERVIKAISDNESCTCEIKLWTKKADIIQEMAMHHPDVLHFAGHGDCEGRLCVHSDLGGSEYLHPKELFANLSECCGFLQIVVLAACYSSTQANEIARYINVVVCMNGEIAIDAMELFTKTFYAALTGGSSVQESFDMGIAQLKMNMTQYAGIPKLVLKEGLKAKNLMLISSYNKIKKEA